MKQMSMSEIPPTVSLRSLWRRGKPQVAFLPTIALASVGAQWWRRRMKRKLFKFLSLTTSYCLLATSFLLLATPAAAYSPFKQTDWSGGYGQQVWSNNLQFYQQYHAKYSTPNQLTIDNSGTANWYNAQWKYRRKISFNNQYNGEVTHFPVLIKLEHKVNFNYDLAHEDGNDLLFTDSDGSTVIPHDIEKWNKSGTSYIWVKVPKIDASSKDDTIFMYYGNPTAADSRNAGKVFDNKFTGVWHLNESPQNGGRYADATNNTKNASWTNTLTGGNSQRTEAFIAGGVDQTLNPDSTYVSVSDTNFPSGAAARTLSIWFYGYTDRGTLDIFYYGTASAGQQFILRQNPGQNCLCVGFNSHVFGSTNLKTGWTHMAVVVPNNADTTDDIQIYVNGSPIVATTQIGTVRTLNTVLDGTSYIGYGTMVDEARISHVARDPSWIKAEYTTATGDLQNYGSEETVSAHLLSSIFDAGSGNGWGYLSYLADEPPGTSARIKIRTGNNMYLNDAPDFATCNSIINKTDISSNSCVHDGDRYFQYQALLDTTDTTKTPTLKEISITDYLPSTTKPIVKGVFTLAPSPSPLGSDIYDLRYSTPKPAPSPSLTTSHYPLITPVLDFFNALFH